MIKIEFACDHCKVSKEYWVTSPKHVVNVIPADWEHIFGEILCKACIKIAREGAMDALDRCQ